MPTSTASNDSFKVHKFSSKLPEAEAARQRENQRRHRARVKEKIAELESSLAETNEKLEAALQYIRELEAECQRLREPSSSSVYTPEPRDESPAEQLLWMSQSGRNGYTYSQPPQQQHQFESYQQPPKQRHQHRHQPPLVSGLDVLASISSSESAAQARHRTYHPQEIDCARNLASLPSYEPTPMASPRDMSPVAALLSMPTASQRGQQATGFYSPSATTISASPSTESPGVTSVFNFNSRSGHYNAFSNSNSQSSIGSGSAVPTDRIDELINCLDSNNNNNGYVDDNILTLPAPRPGESTMPCREAFSIVRKVQTTRPEYCYDADDREVENVAREQWRPGFRSASSTDPNSGCRVQTHMVFDFVDHITEP